MQKSGCLEQRTWDRFYIWHETGLLKWQCCHRSWLTSGLVFLGQAKDVMSPTFLTLPLSFGESPSASLCFSCSHRQWSYPDSFHENKWCSTDMEDSLQFSVPESWIYCKLRHEDKNSYETHPCLSKPLVKSASFPQSSCFFHLWVSLLSSKGGSCCSGFNLWLSWLCLSVLELLSVKITPDCSCISLVVVSLRVKKC